MTEKEEIKQVLNIIVKLEEKLDGWGKKILAISEKKKMTV